MDFLKTPFFLGDLRLPNNLFYAPLAGCSDLPFRQMGNLYRPGLFYCEMVKMDALVRHDVGTYRLLDYTPDMHPIGAQLCGSKPDLAAPSARIIEELGFDTVDLNCGCPVDKVTKDGSGSGLLKEPERIGEILSNIVAAVTIPVTVKIRTGWDEDHIVAADIVSIAEQAGAKAITVHGRTRAQGYQGNANWERIRACKEKAKTIHVIGNGDVFDAQSAEHLFSTTRCDAILVARGTLGKPWIVEDIERNLRKEPPLKRDSEWVKEVLLLHFEKILRYRSDKQALLDFRRVGCWYLKDCYGAKSLRVKINQSQTPKEAIQHIQEFYWEKPPFVPLTKQTF